MIYEEWEIANILSEPEVVDTSNEVAPFIQNREDEYVNPQKLCQHSQDLHYYKPEKQTNKQNQQKRGEVGKMYHSQAKIYLKLMPDKKRKISLGGFYSWEAYIWELLEEKI